MTLRRTTSWSSECAFARTSDLDGLFRPRRLEKLNEPLENPERFRIATTDAYVDAGRQRKKVEVLFANLKRILRLNRLRLRGPNGARDELLHSAYHRLNCSRKGWLTKTQIRPKVRNGHQR